jgi:hypothetical protein
MQRIYLNMLQTKNENIFIHIFWKIIMNKDMQIFILFNVFTETK